VNIIKIFPFIKSLKCAAFSHSGFAKTERERNDVGASLSANSLLFNLPTVSAVETPKMNDKNIEGFKCFLFSKEIEYFVLYLFKQYTMY